MRAKRTAFPATAALVAALAVPAAATAAPRAVALDPASAQPVVAFTGPGGILTSEHTG